MMFSKQNTRTKVNSESCCETDKLPFDKAVNLISEVMMSLIRGKYHFSIFYAEGQRSPHIRIYDFFELEELNPQQRIKEQINFWRKHIPFGCFQYVDTGMFVDDRPLQLEFALHWKYKTPFNLLFEWIPEPQIIPREEKEVVVKKSYTSSRIKVELLKCGYCRFPFVKYKTMGGNWLCPFCMKD